MASEKDTVGTNGLKSPLSYKKGQQEDRGDDFSKYGVESIRQLAIDFSSLRDLQGEKVDTWDK